MNMITLDFERATFETRLFLLYYYSPTTFQEDTVWRIIYLLVTHIFTWPNSNFGTQRNAQLLCISLYFQCLGLHMF